MPDESSDVFIPFFIIIVVLLDLRKRFKKWEFLIRFFCRKFGKHLTLKLLVSLSLFIGVVDSESSL